MMRALLTAIFLFVILGGVPLAGAAEATFDHQVHLEEYEGDCASCHQPGDLDIVPPRVRCEECHEADFLDGVKIPARMTHDSFWYRDHGPYTKKEARNCESCHDDRYCFDCHRSGFADEQGKLNIHRSDYRVTHPIAARADARSCSVCHEERFCTDCHADFTPQDLAFASHRRGFSDITGFGTPHSAFTPAQCPTCHPGSVLTTHDWSDNHAREARRSLPTCQSCHPEGEVCLKCHSAREGLVVNPHPDNWGDIEDILNGAGDGRTCRRCH